MRAPKITEHTRAAGRPLGFPPQEPGVTTRGWDTPHMVGEHPCGEKHLAPGPWAMDRGGAPTAFLLSPGKASLT